MTLDLRRVPPGNASRKPIHSERRGTYDASCARIVVGQPREERRTDVERAGADCGCRAPAAAAAVEAVADALQNGEVSRGRVEEDRATAAAEYNGEKSSRRSCSSGRRTTLRFLPFSLSVRLSRRHFTRLRTPSRRRAVRRV